MRASRRLTMLIAWRSVGEHRQVSVNLMAVLLIATAAVTVPILIGLGARWSARVEIERLRAANASLQVENTSYRAATGELTMQIQALEGTMDELGAHVVEPAAARAMQKLPSAVRSRATGGRTEAHAALSDLLATSLSSPEDTFGVLRALLQGLEDSLRHVRKNVEQREALAAATPSIWPAYGWITGRFGDRSDPFTGEAGFHQGLDISTEKGQPVFATADGTVESAAFTGDYGNLIVLRHRFGLSTRYAHLSRFAVKPGGSVSRGDIIGYVGSTGRSTGSHLHYEILANGRLLNPLKLLTEPAVR